MQDKKRKNQTRQKTEFFYFIKPLIKIFICVILIALHILIYSKLGHIIGKNVCSRLVLGKCVATLGDAFFGVSLGVRFFILGESMEYSLEQLQQINLHSLRVIARDIGVRAPTALTKNALINEIIKIQSGVKKPCVPNKRGRPASKCVSEMQIISSPIEKANIIKIKQQAKKEFIAQILKELVSSIIIGITIAVVCFAKIMLIDRLYNNISMMRASVISLVCFVSIVMAKLVGSILPLLAKKIKLDPAVVASPLMTTIVDALSLIIYCTIAIAVL